MKVALLGYGKMGRVIDQVAQEQFVDVVARVDKEPLLPESVGGAEVLIDFSVPEAMLQHITFACQQKKQLVIGTTGWDKHHQAARQLVEEAGIGLIYSPNFSLATHCFMHLVRQASHLFNQLEGYDVAGYELHHRWKGDSPSGTAKMLSEAICKELPEKRHPKYERVQDVIQPEELHFASVRCGHIPGTHTVLFDSESDTVELTLRARNRIGWARGALHAASWISTRKGFYTLDQLVEELLGTSVGRRP